MTKKELIEKLEGYDDNAIIVIAEDKVDPWSGHHYGVNLYDVEAWEGDNDNKQYFVIRQEKLKESIDK